MDSGANGGGLELRVSRLERLHYEDEGRLLAAIADLKSDILETRRHLGVFHEEAKALIFQLAERLPKPKKSKRPKGKRRM